MAQKRSDKRIPIDEVVEVAYEDFQSFKVEYAENISLGGMYIRAQTALPVNQLIQFKLKIKDIDREISGKAIVAWTKEVANGSGDISVGLGLKFTELHGDSRAFIREFVDKHVNI